MNGKFIVKVLCSACVLQIILTIYFILRIYVSTTVIHPDQVKPIDNGDDVSEEFKMTYFMKEGDYLDTDNHMAAARHGGSIREVLSKLKTIKTVEILGKAAISIFLWEHILGGIKKVDKNNPSIYTGRLSLPEVIFHYQEGPGLQLDSLKLKSNNIILIVNGRTKAKVSESRKWLDYLHANHSNNTKILLVMLGNEKCNNTWIQTYLSPKGRVHGVFIVYDDPIVDGSVLYQWPLGVATYRQFPILTERQILSNQPRKFLCNLQATNHANGSRNELFRTLESEGSACVVKERKQWKLSEDISSSNDYISNLVSSDLTLCPAGFNTETYRVYEAIAAGSVPVIEDVPSSGGCDSTTGWRLLKQFKPPVIWIKNWKKELPQVLKKECEMTDQEKIVRRERLLNWSEWFKLRLKDRFIFVVQSKLLKPG